MSTLYKKRSEALAKSGMSGRFNIYNGIFATVTALMIFATIIVCEYLGICSMIGAFVVLVFNFVIFMGSYSQPAFFTEGFYPGGLLPPWRAASRKVRVIEWRDIRSVDVLKRGLTYKIKVTHFDGRTWWVTGKDQDLKQDLATIQRIAAKKCTPEISAFLKKPLEERAAWTNSGIWLEGTTQRAKTTGRTGKEKERSGSRNIYVRTDARGVRHLKNSSAVAGPDKGMNITIILVKVMMISILPHTLLGVFAMVFRITIEDAWGELGSLLVIALAAFALGFIVSIFGIWFLTFQHARIFEEGYFKGGMTSFRDLLDSTVPVTPWDKVEKIALRQEHTKSGYVWRFKIFTVNGSLDSLSVSKKDMPAALVHLNKRIRNKLDISVFEYARDHHSLQMRMPRKRF